MMKRIFFVLALMAAGTALRAQSLGGEYRLKRIVPVEGRQGIAADSNYYYVSGSTALYKYDKQGRLVAENEHPFEGLPPTSTVGAYIPDTPAPAAETVEPTEPAVRYPLTDAERDVVERVVMAEAGGESFEGQMLVAQCILNAAEKRGVEPSEAVVLYSYTKSRPDPTQRVKDAVAAVFDRGETVVDEPILYFYNPALVTSDFHESQIFVIEEGGHRFFAERSTR